MPGFEDLWFNKAEVLLQEAEDLVSKSLYKAGWSYTSQTPCSVWMWEKQIGGITYRVSRDDAATWQERWDREAYFKQFPDELAD